MIRICFAGVTGWTAPPIVAAIDAADDVVTTEIVFGGAGERLIMRHDPGESPDPYMAGTHLAIRRVADVPERAPRIGLTADR